MTCGDKTWIKSITVAASILVLAGCMTHKQNQYFAVRDPQTGAANYYRLEITGKAGLGADYNFQAGYFSAVAVDILRGQMPEIPELDLPIERMQTYDSLMAHLDRFLLQEAAKIAPISQPDAQANALREKLKATRAEKLQLERAANEAISKNIDSGLEVAEETLSELMESQKIAKEDVEKAKQSIENQKSEIHELRERVSIGFELIPNSSSPSNRLAALETNLKELDQTFAAASNRLQILTHEVKAGQSAVAKATAEEVSNQLEARMLERRLDDLRGEERELMKTVAILDRQYVDRVLGGPANVESFGERHFLELARLVWLSTISGADLAAIGMNQTTSPFHFRKLVFWSTSTQADLNQLASQVDSVADNVAKIGRSYKQLAKERNAAAVERFTAATTLLQSFTNIPPSDLAKMQSLLSLLAPSVAQETNVLSFP